MSTIRKHVSSFNGGEMSPLMESRLGVEKLASGCRLLKNFIPHIHGPVFRRGGFEYMGEGMGSDRKSRLLGFNFSTTTNFVLELHPDGLGIWHSGGRMTLVADVPLPYEEEEIFEVQAVQINDVVYLTHPNHWPRKLVRYADNDWRLQNIFAALDSATVSPGYTETGPFGRATRHRWTWTDYSETVTATLIADILASGPPDVESKVTSLYLASIAGTALRYLFDLVVPATGTWTLSYQGSGSYSVDGVVKSTNRTGAVTTFTMSLVAGQRYAIDFWKFTATTPPSGTRLRISGPGYSARDIPADWFKDKDVTVAATYNQENWGNLWPPVLDENVTPITLTPSATSGTIDLVSDDPVFNVDHIGGYWQIAHRRSVAHTELVGAVGAFSGSSAQLRVLGAWDLFTYGIWEGDLALERLNAAGDWEPVRTWKSNNDRNVIASGVTTWEETFRLTVTGGDGTAASGAAVPRFTLECADAKIYGLVKITGVAAPDATAITGAADNGSGLIRVTSVAHGLTTGQQAIVAGVTGTGGLPAAIHGTWVVTVIGADTVDLVGSAFAGVYTSGGTITFATGTEATATVVRPLHSTDPTALWSESAWSDYQGHPRTVGLHEQRLFFAGTRRQPQRTWGSTAADFENFRRSTFDDGALDFTIAAQESNGIQWITSQGALIIGTAGEEWTVDAAGADAPLSPTNLKVNRQSRFGSSFIGAQLINEVAIFAQRTGRKLRQFQYSESTDGYTATDLTVLAEHITGDGIIQMAFQSQAQSILWAVTKDGRLIGMTFEKEQNVFAWHDHYSFGLTIESVAVIYGDPVDEVWITAVRDELGEPFRMVMRMDMLCMAQDFSDPARLNYMDQSKVFEFEEPTDTVEGLDWLEGMTISVLVDGATHPDVTVESGTITLERDGSTVIVGIPPIATLQTMPFDVPMQAGSAQGMAWKLNRVAVRVYESSAGEAAESEAVNEDDWEEIHPREPGDAMDTAVPLFTGEKRLDITASSSDQLRMTIRQRLPLPLNVTAIVQIFDVYDR